MAESKQHFIRRRRNVLISAYQHAIRWLEPVISWLMQQFDRFRRRKPESEFVISKSSVHTPPPPEARASPKREGRSAFYIASWLTTLSIVGMVAALGYRFSGRAAELVNLVRSPEPQPAVRSYRTPFADPFVGQDATLRGPALIVIPAGSFTMGSPTQDEQPQHTVNIARPFAMSLYEVSYSEYRAFATATRHALMSVQAALGTTNLDLPVQNVSWFDALEYTRWLSLQTGKTYRIPTEAEWEYAARAGVDISWSWGNDADGCTRAANIRCGISPEEAPQLEPSGSLAPNQFGLFDMAGNIAEWTSDCYAPTYANAPTNGFSVDRRSCPARVFRGGWWLSTPAFARASFRASATPDYRDYYIGIRLVRELTEPELAALASSNNTPLARR